MSIFSGIWVPLITPFADGAVDHAALRALVRRYADAGVAGLCALGTTGEPATLDAAEQDAVLATILDEARAHAHASGSLNRSPCWSAYQAITPPACSSASSN